MQRTFRLLSSLPALLVFFRSDMGSRHIFEEPLEGPGSPLVVRYMLSAWHATLQRSRGSAYAPGTSPGRMMSGFLRQRPMQHVYKLARKRPTRFRGFAETQLPGVAAESV